MSAAPRVLVLNVDDYEPSLYARSQVLRGAGFEVREASTGKDALRLAASENPDVVLLDVNLPDMSGFEVCRRIKADPALASLPVLHISATFVNAGHRAMGLEGGADGYLTEPVEAPVLVASVNALLRMRRAEEGQRALARQWQMTFDSISDGVALLSPAGTIVQCNAAFARIFGRDAADLIGRALHEQMPDGADQDPGLPFLRMLDTRQRESAEVPAGHRWLRVTADPVLEDTRLIAAVYTVSDVTDRKRAEEERARFLVLEQVARAEAEAANRAKDEFLATLSHELRAPLNAMLGWARMLRGGKLDEATAARALETIERNAKLQSQLIEDLLDVSRIISGKVRLTVRPVDLSQVIDVAVDAVHPAALAKSIRLESVLDRSAGPVLGDADRLQQVVWNLLSNAVKFTPSGGRVDVRLEGDESEVRIRVHDTGRGIAPDFLPYVFDRFRQGSVLTTRTHGGLGLGLAIVRHLIELHGGTVQAESPGPGAGATFTVRLPFRPFSAPSVEREVEPVAVTGAGEGPPALHGVTALVVDDEADARVLLSTMLQQWGARVIAVGSADEALEVLGRLRPDVLVSDIAMPDKDGYDLITAVRALPSERATVPALAVAARARREDEDRALRAGFQVHLAKPVEPPDFLDAVKRLTARAGG
jgi:PAS domain S-box-containing protein